MSGDVYTATLAAADLAEAGLLSGVLAARDGTLVPVDPAAAEGGFHGAGLDSRRLAPGELFVGLAGRQADGRDYVARAVARSHWALTRTAGETTTDSLPGSPGGPGAGVLLSEDPQAALAHLAACRRKRCPAVVTAVTGTNGKTTTKDLLAALLSGCGSVHATRGNLNNHLGVPLTLLGLAADHAYAVVEMGASAVGEIAALAALARPAVGVITNAAPAHLEGFGSLEGVISGKGELVAALPAEGTAVLNADSPGFDAWRERTPARVVSFGAAGDHPWTWHADPAGGGVLELDGETWPVPLAGEHNGANLAAAVLAARAAGGRDTDLRRGLAGFAGASQRGECRELGGRTVLDETYNANPTSLVASARTLLALPGAGRTVAVLGAMAELGPDSEEIHRQTGAELAALGLDTLVTVGEAARPLGAGFDAAERVQHCASHAAAARWLARHTAAGDRILVKGSRSAAMERVLDIFAAGLGPNRAG